MQNILEVKNLKVKYPNSNYCAINDISFKLHNGEILGIIGESGSGKSTIAHALLRLLPTNTMVEGQILFFNKQTNQKTDLNKLSSKEIIHYRGKKLSMIFQEPMSALNPSIKCGKQIGEILQLHTSLNKKERKEKIFQLLNEVALANPEETYHKYPHQLSGGQRQRVMIAMAIACNPDIILADEPTTALDVTIQKEILNLLKTLSEQKHISLIIISHDLRVIKYIANKVVILKEGQIIESGETAKILNMPQHNYTKLLIQCRPPQIGKPYRLPSLSNFNSDLAYNSKYINQELNFNIKKDSPILQVKSLNVKLKTVQSKKREILHSISFVLWEGETLGIVGESGSGKTTLGRSIMSLLKLNKGEILANSRPIKNLTKKEYSRFIQLIFQDPYSSLNPNITIGEAIREPMHVHNLYRNKKEEIEQVNQLLNKVNLPTAWYDRYPHQLSGGQRQRVVIARALALKPQIIICDECVASLDISIASQILNLLNDLKEELNLTYIFISHDLELVQYMSNRIIVMKDGTIIEENDTDQLFKYPQTEYSQKLIAANLS